MRNLRLFLKVAVVAVIIMMILLFLISTPASARGGHRGGGGHGGFFLPCLFGGLFTLGAIANQTMIYDPPPCYKRIIRYEYDAYGRLVRIPPKVILICPQ